MKHFVINCGTFPYEILISLGTEKELMRKLKQYKFEPSEIKDTQEMFATSKQGYAARFWMLGSKSIIHFPKFENSIENFSIMQHELFHAVFNILKYAGMPCNRSTEETHAYLLQYLTKQVLENVK